MTIMQTTALNITPIVLGCLLAFNASATKLDNLTDADGDGVISAAEIQDARAAHKAEMLSQYDADGNGELSRDERSVMRADRDSELLSLFDADGNGELSRSERRAAHDARRDAMDAQLDVNQDGEVSAEESAGIEELHESNRGERKGKRGHGGKRANR